MKLKGKSAVITGASQGLGKEIAKQFVIEGADISICSRKKQDLDKVLTELAGFKKADQNIFMYEADVSIESDVSSFVNFSISNMGRVDILVNNAGIYGPKGNVDIVDVEAWMQTFSINVMGTLYMCKNIIPELKKRGKGKIINL